MLTLSFANIHGLVLRRVSFSLCLIGCSGSASGGQAASATLTATQPPGSPAISRRYRDGETVSYAMRASNESPARAIHYEARVRGTVKRSADGEFVEDLAWTELKFNGQPFALSPASADFRESLSLAPGFRLTVPDLSHVQPILIGPITDLLTFYADVQLAMRQKALVRAGDHLYVKHGVPNSWADGTRVILGQDAIDFDMELKTIDPVVGVATLVVRHVPPAQLQVKLPVEWMQTPAGETNNNWVQVEHTEDGRIVAGVGIETFEATIKIGMPSGRILSATMNNPVEVTERSCEDAALTKCANPSHYKILRQISLEDDPPQQ